MFKYFALIAVVVASRLLPHPPNFACIGAMGLFAGCYFAGSRAYLLPLVALLISDVIGQVFGFAGMGFYNPVTMIAVYAGAIAAVPIGRWISRQQNPLKYPAGSLAASTLFFLISNFGVWLGPWYPTSPEGLLACYASAVPFFGYTIAGDLAFTAALFGSWEWSRRYAGSQVAAAA